MGVLDPGSAHAWPSAYFRAAHTHRLDQLWLTPIVVLARLPFSAGMQNSALLSKYIPKSIIGRGIGDVLGELNIINFSLSIIYIHPTVYTKLLYKILNDAVTRFCFMVTLNRCNMFTLFDLVNCSMWSGE